MEDVSKWPGKFLLYTSNYIQINLINTKTRIFFEVAKNGKPFYPFQGQHKATLKIGLQPITIFLPGSSYTAKYGGL